MISYFIINLGIKSRGNMTGRSNRSKTFSETATLENSRKTSGVKLSFRAFDGLPPSTKINHKKIAFVQKCWYIASQLVLGN